MRITIEIDEKALRQIQKETGQKKKSPAVQRALEAYLRERMKQRLIQMALNGETDYAATNEELEGRSRYSPD